MESVQSIIDRVRSITESEKYYRQSVMKKMRTRE